MSDVLATVDQCIDLRWRVRTGCPTHDSRFISLLLSKYIAALFIKPIIGNYVGQMFERVGPSRLSSCG
ncbi:MAG: hypothetical protein C0482_12725 [Gordonia sp.]|nr:hypothetical protein [Gordonia sp. (in: high G+C Gram-positive bacteria)]